MLKAVKAESHPNYLLNAAISECDGITGLCVDGLHFLRLLFQVL